jgi:hypothetical protein
VPSKQGDQKTEAKVEHYPGTQGIAVQLTLMLQLLMLPL